MKRSLSMSTLLILSFCFPLCACTDFVDPIEYTAEKPLIEYRGKSYENSVVHSFNNAFTHFKNYYVKNFMDSELYLFDSCLGESGYGGYYPPYFDIVEDDDGLYVYEEFECYDNELGCSPDDKKKIEQGLFGGGCFSFNGNIAIKQLSNGSGDKDFSFEFGIQENERTSFNGDVYTYTIKYANIFSGEECFATFYFYPNVPITQEWFENCLSNYLVWGDSLVYEETENSGGEE